MTQTDPGAQVLLEPAYTMDAMKSQEEEESDSEDCEESTESTNSGRPLAKRKVARERPSTDSIDIELIRAQRQKFLQYTEEVEDMMNQELHWLRRAIQKTPENVRQCLVSHRGFHHSDDALSRPLENTIAAFTQAWAEGVIYCECDVTVLADGHVVMNHDKCLTRLQLQRRRAKSPNKKPGNVLENMSFGDVLRTPLKNGLNAPLLANVLHHAKALKGKLVVELKPGCTAMALVNGFKDDESLFDAVPVIMSFDLPLIQDFAKQYAEAGLPAERRPRVALLTVGKISDPALDFEIVVTAKDFANIRNLIGDTIDGVYVEWAPELLGSEIESFTKLCSEMPVGVWQYSGDECDHLSVAERLVACGATYVNTDLPYSFTKSTPPQG